MTIRENYEQWLRDFADDQDTIRELKAMKKEYAVPRRTVIEDAGEIVVEAPGFVEEEVVFCMDRFTDHILVLPGLHLFHQPVRVMILIDHNASLRRIDHRIDPPCENHPHQHHHKIDQCQEDHRLYMGKEFPSTDQRQLDISNKVRADHRQNL